MALILVVDDDEIIAELVAEAFAGAGHMVSVVHHGDEALRTIHRCAPDLIVLDCNLPGKTGMEILRELRAVPHGATIPVIMLTSLSRQLHMFQAVSHGADDYITKPFDPGDLLTRAEALLMGQKLCRLVPAAAALDATGAMRLG